MARLTRGSLRIDAVSTEEDRKDRGVLSSSAAAHVRPRGRAEGPLPVPVACTATYEPAIGAHGPSHARRRTDQRGQPGTLPAHHPVCRVEAEGDGRPAHPGVGPTGGGGRGDASESSARVVLIAERSVEGTARAACAVSETTVLAVASFVGVQGAGPAGAATLSPVCTSTTCNVICDPRVGRTSTVRPRNPGGKGAEVVPGQPVTRRARPDLR